MTISLNISTNQKDSGAGSLLLGQQSSQSSGFDSQFDGEVSNQIGSARQELAAATHGYDDFQLQHAGEQSAANTKKSEPKTAEAAAISVATDSASQDDAMAIAEPAQSDILLALITQSNAIQQLQSKAPSASNHSASDTVAKDSAVTDSIAKATLTINPPAAENDAVATSAIAAIDTKPLAALAQATKTDKALAVLSDVPLTLRKLMQQVQQTQPTDIPHEISQLTSLVSELHARVTPDDGSAAGQVTVTDPSVPEDLALDASSYWQLRQQQQDPATQQSIPASQPSTEASSHVAAAPEQSQVQPKLATTAVSAELPDTVLAGEAAPIATSVAIPVVAKATMAGSSKATSTDITSPIRVSLPQVDNETDPTIGLPITPIDTVMSGSAEGAGSKDAKIADTSNKNAPVVASVAQSAPDVAAETSATPLQFNAPPMVGAPVRKRSLQLGAEELDLNKPAPAQQLPVDAGRDRETIPVLPPEQVASASAQLQPMTASKVEKRTIQPIVEPQPSPFSVDVAGSDVTEPTNELQTSADSGVAAASPSTSLPASSEDKAPVTSPVLTADSAVAVSTLPDPVVSQEPQFTPSTLTTTVASTTLDSIKSSDGPRDLPAADNKATYAEFMQQSNQQQGEQQAQQQHKEQPVLVRQSESMVTNQESLPTTRVVSTEPTAPAAVTATTHTAPALTAAVTSHVNKLTETLKSAELAQQQLPLELQQPNAASKLAERVMYQVHQKIQSAEVQLHPEDLGAMQIKVSLQQDQLSVQFVVQQGAAKDALEQQMPRLKEMLQQQGMQLAEGQVEQRQSQQGEQRHAQSQQRAIASSADELETGSLLQQGQVQVKVSDRAVDYYA